MKDRPPSVDDDLLLDALADGWGIPAHSADYASVGFGSYHWIATCGDHDRVFVTVDDLAGKAWLGEGVDSAYEGLRRAFDTAVALRDHDGLEFVVAPVPALDGSTVRRLGARHSIAVFPFVEGAAGDFGDDIDPQQRSDVIALLVELHRATPSASHVARRMPLELPGRSGLEAALRDLGRTWQGGPFAEPAREWLAARAGDLGRLLADFDRLVGDVSATNAAWVITHGEPHPGNVLRTAGSLVLIDWDTVGLAPPERDLWLVATAAGEEAEIYGAATGRAVDPAAMSLYRLRWELSDIASYLALFRAPHQSTADTMASWLYLEGAIGR